MVCSNWNICWSLSLSYSHTHTHTYNLQDYINHSPELQTCLYKLPECHLPKLGLKTIPAFS